MSIFRLHIFLAKIKVWLHDNSTVQLSGNECFIEDVPLFFKSEHTVYGYVKRSVWVRRIYWYFKYLHLKGETDVNGRNFPPWQIWNKSQKKYSPKKIRRKNVEKKIEKRIKGIKLMKIMLQKIFLYSATWYWNTNIK